MHILFLSRWFPHPPDNGSKIRINNLLRGLAKSHQVTLVSFYDPVRSTPDQNSLRGLCQDVHVVPLKPFQPGSKKSLLGYFASTPRAYLDMYSNEMEQRIKAVIQQKEIELVIASQIDMAAYAGAFIGLPAIFEEVEVGVFLDRVKKAHSITSRLRSYLTWLKHRRYLLGLMRHFRLCTVVSENERRLLSHEVSGIGRIEVVPNCVDMDACDNVVEPPQPDSLIFTGSLTYQPNYEAMCWFLTEVFPQVRAKVPQLRLEVTGDHGGLPLPGSEGVTLTGMLPDVRPSIARAWCSVVPLQSGGGTRLKILEAMALHTPVISTSKGAEGLDVEPGKHMLIADNAQDFANCIVRLLQQSDLRQQLAEQAYQLVRAQYNWDTVMKRFLSLIDQVAQGDA